MALVPEDPKKEHYFSLKIAKVLEASGSGYGIVAVVAVAVVVIVFLLTGLPGA